jgi:hypothetical protein
MKKILLRIVLPGIVLGIVYQIGYNSGRVVRPPSAVFESQVSVPVIDTSEMKPTDSAALVAPVSGIKPMPPKVIETSDTVSLRVPVVKRSPIVRVRRSPEGSEGSVDSLPVNSGVVFRAPNISGDTSLSPEISEQKNIVPSELQPLKPAVAPETLRSTQSPVPIAKPASVPQDKDCGCGK